MGTLSILNVGAGDVKISYDKSNAPEAVRAKRIIKDMLKRGYALLVQLEDGSYQRAKKFDESAGEYIIADFDPDAEEDEDANKSSSQEAQEKETAPKLRAKRGRPSIRERRIPMQKANAVGVARSAGG